MRPQPVQKWDMQNAYRLHTEGSYKLIATGFQDLTVLDIIRPDCHATATIHTHVAMHVLKRINESLGLARHVLIACDWSARLPT